MSLPVPNLDENIIAEISSLLSKQYTLRAWATQLVHEAKADVEALIEGRLDVESLVAGRVQPPTWEDIEV